MVVAAEDGCQERVRHAGDGSQRRGIPHAPNIQLYFLLLEGVDVGHLCLVRRQLGPISLKLFALLGKLSLDSRPPTANLPLNLTLCKGMREMAESVLLMP